MNGYSKNLIGSFAEKSDRIQLILGSCAKKSTHMAAIAGLAATMAACSPATKQISFEVQGPQTSIHEYIASSAGLSQMAGVPVLYTHEKGMTAEQITGIVSSIIDSMEGSGATKKDVVLGLQQSVENNKVIAFRNPADLRAGCLINMPPMPENLNHVASMISVGSQPDKFERIPGTPEYWRTLLTLHELQHCRQEVKSGFFRSDPYETVMKFEVEADQTAIQSYRALVKDDPNFEVPSAFVHLRNIGSLHGAILDRTHGFDDYAHATATFIDSSGSSEARHTPRQAIDAYKSLAEKIEPFLPISTGDISSNPVFDGVSVSLPFSEEAILAAVRSTLKDENTKLSPLEKEIAEGYVNAWQALAPNLAASKEAQSTITLKTRKDHGLEI